MKGALASSFSGSNQADWAPFRPVQYLGSKLRVLDEIRSAASTIIRPGGTVADLFAGTTVVSQELAAVGARVTAVDTQRYAQFFGAALLGVDRVGDEQVDPEKIISSALENVPSIGESWRKSAELEREALQSLDAPMLRSLYRTLPFASSSDYADSHTICTVYAGTYFGVSQAIEIDLLRAAIQRLTQSGFLSSWQIATAMTGLMHAASMTVHSAGKHFAQPLGDGSGNSQFLNRRLMADRTISVIDCFREGCRKASATPFRAADGHAAVRASAEEFVRSKKSRYDLYYLDPPYTAQQYSRFYHVLETLADNGCPKLPPGGANTIGLYPLDRYKSAFSSRRKAPAIMEELLTEIAAGGSAALISYSSSAHGSEGNARMITLEELLGFCSRAFGSAHVECSRMPHRYRQFNNAKNANQKRDDAEILILCKPA